MGDKKHPFDHIILLIAATGTNTIKHDRVGSGRFYCYQHIGVINETHNYTRLRLISKRVGDNFLLTSQQNPTADRLYWDTETYFLSEGEQLAAELTGCTADDVLRLYVRGWWSPDGKVE